MTGLEITTDQTTDLFVANLFGWHSCGLPIISENVAKSVLKFIRFNFQLPTIVGNIIIYCVSPFSQKFSLAYKNSGKTCSPPFVSAKSDKC